MEKITRTSGIIITLEEKFLAGKFPLSMALIKSKRFLSMDGL